MKKFLLTTAMAISGFYYSQALYLDPTTTAALFAYSSALKNQQQKTNEEQNKLQKAQAFVATQMTLANNIQQKVYRGLREVSGTLTNGLQVKMIYEDLNKCGQYILDIKDLVRIHPQYSIFGVKASEKAYMSTLRLYDDVMVVLKDDERNLMLAGDRYALLDRISNNVKVTKIWLLTVKLNIERAERYGFWRSINPFQGYINTDKTIVENIMRKFKNNF